MIEPEEYSPDPDIVGDAIENEAQQLGMSNDDVWYTWKLGLELRKQIAMQVNNAPRLYDPRYEEAKVVDAWFEDGGIYAVVDAKGWEENLGFRVQVFVEDSHTDEPASERPESTSV